MIHPLHHGIETELPFLGQDIDIDDSDLMQTENDQQSPADDRDDLAVVRQYIAQFMGRET